MRQLLAACLVSGVTSSSGHEAWIAGLSKWVTQAVGELLRGGETAGWRRCRANAATEQQQLRGAEPLGRACVATQHHGEQSARIHRGRAPGPQLVQDRRLHLLASLAIKTGRSSAALI